MNHNVITRILLTLVLVVALSGCGQVDRDSNFTLAGGESVDGTLFIFHQNAILEEDSLVDGSVVMLCCNLTVRGSVNGSVFLLTGNLAVKSSADVKGDVSLLSGNVSK